MDPSSGNGCSGCHWHRPDLVRTGTGFSCSYVDSTLLDYARFPGILQRVLPGGSVSGREKHKNPVHRTGSAPLVDLAVGNSIDGVVGTQNLLDSASRIAFARSRGDPVPGSHSEMPATNSLASSLI